MNGREIVPDKLRHQLRDRLKATVQHQIDDSEYRRATRSLDEIEREIKAIEADLRAVYSKLPRAARWAMRRLWPSIFGEIV